MTKILRRLLWLLALLLILLGTAPLLIPTTHYKPPLEQLLGEQLETQVKIGKLRFWLIPWPVIRLEGIRLIGGAEEGEIQISRVDARVRLSELWQHRLQIPTLEIFQPRISQPLAERLYQHLASLPPQPDTPFSFHIQQLHIHQLKLDQSAWLMPVSAIINLDREHHPTQFSATTSEHHLQLQGARTGESYSLRLLGRDRRLPIGRGLLLDSFEVRAKLQPGSLLLESLSARTAGGMLGGNGRLSWGNGWQLASALRIEQVKADKLLQRFGQRILSGDLDSQCILQASAMTWQALQRTSDLQCDFLIQDGAFHEIDLYKAAKLILVKGDIDGTTPFQRLTGHLRLKHSDLILSELQLEADTLTAEGRLSIRQAQQIEGEIEVGIRHTAELLEVPLRISGNLDDPSVRPTDEALAGAAAGTAVLGPGLGTAVGIKAGKVMKGLKRLFNK